MVRHLAKRVYFAYLFLLVVGRPCAPFYKTYLDLERYSSYLTYSLYIDGTRPYVIQS